jgi:hypothetical protein
MGTLPGPPPRPHARSGSLSSLHRTSPSRLLIRILSYLWASPNSLLALAIVLLLIPFGARARVVAGVLEVHGSIVGRILQQLPPRGMAVAITLGHVVLGASQRDLDRSRAHERVHVRQYGIWGPFFLPASGLSSLWQRLRGRDPYRDNHFEREAYGDR